MFDPSEIVNQYILQKLKGSGYNGSGIDNDVPEGGGPDLPIRAEVKEPGGEPAMEEPEKDVTTSDSSGQSDDSKNTGQTSNADPVEEDLKKNLMTAQKGQDSAAAGGVKHAQMPLLSQNPAIQAYIASLLQPDPRLPEAQKEAQFQDSIAPLRTGAAQLGKNLVAVTSGIAGIKPTDISTTPTADPIQKYIQNRQAETAGPQAALGAAKTASQVDLDLAKAQKDLESAAPGSKQAELIRQQIQYLQLKRMTEQGSRRADIAEGSLEEKKRHDPVAEEAALQGAGARKEMAKQVGRRNDLRSTEIENKAGEAIVPGIKWNNPAAVPLDTAKEAEDSISAFNSIKDQIGKFNKLDDPTFGYASLPLTSRRAEIKGLRDRLLPLISQATGMGRFTVAHQHLADEILRNPAKLEAMVNDGTLNTQLSGLLDDAYTILKNHVEHARGGGGKLLGPGEANQPMPKLNRETSQFSDGGASPDSGNVSKEVAGYRYNGDRTKRKASFTDGSEGPEETLNGGEWE